MGIKTIFVDFGGVLFLCIKDYRNHPSPYAGIPQKELDDWEHKLNIGEASSTYYWESFLNKYGIQEEQYLKHIQLFNEAHALNLPLIDLLNSLRKEKKIGLISNYRDTLRSLLEDELNIAGIFDDIVISSEVKLMKPDKAIYQLALDRMHIKPEEAIFIDDRIENIQAATEMGIHAVQFLNNEQAIPEIKQLID